MPENRFFADTPLNPGDIISLEGVEHHHLAHVMRQKVGDTVEVINGKGILASAEVRNIHKKEAELRILTIDREELAPSHPLILIQAIPRLNRLDTIIEKGTELGVDAFWLFPGEKSERSHLTTQRLEALTIAAAKQCGRLYLPEILLKPQLKNWPPQSLTGYYGHLDAQNTLLAAWQPPKNELCIAIGPEAGFTIQEIFHLSSFGLQPVCLHKNILRTDTAAITALSLLSSLSN